MESPLCPPDDPGFRLIETLGWHPDEGPRRAALHLARMARSATALGVPFDQTRAQHLLEQIRGLAPLRCRLTLDPKGVLALETAPLAAAAPLWRVAIHPERLDSDDPWLRHKTTRRALYDRARAGLPAGSDEWLFLNRAGQVCEGTITNVFMASDDGLLTPPLASGLLPGILRAELLAIGRAREVALHPNDLRNAQTLYCGNSLRGLIPATFAPDA
ncbi:aminotransferase class IV family protein [Ruegeria pomeroyi]|uniref:Probable branched-chain-amino-acid aminotransferase n=1 Tax=Ruegeria alba TaxID=2916756 RepID=A0ABS9NW21_9RHOB|nr:aminotransferase class IV family protein [Ruegeria alba]MCE8512960.1 aminotransferase class IV family protein [Ruegeria pomeroyi]MCE8529576.1 aminotransferase class IV family protein [Ruegeria pomeroyi]MCG6558425.1 aminotransferase class IV family protein [Ruegeria alba]